MVVPAVRDDEEVSNLPLIKKGEQRLHRGILMHFGLFCELDLEERKTSDVCHIGFFPQTD